ncbi:MAG: hypothetical protein IPJ75_00485 [Ignavibacteriales bacterium]|nr:hypothetical protein [Ignavibacteriales bacterium]
MEVSNTATDLLFKLTVNGNVATTDWGKFMLGISTGSTATTNTGNGWGRPINLNSVLGGMDYWVGAWVDAGGGANFGITQELHGPGPAPSAFGFTGEPPSVINYHSIIGIFRTRLQVTCCILMLILQGVVVVTEP